MEKLLQEMMAALDVEKSADHVRWLTDHTPSRISGMGRIVKLRNTFVRRLKNMDLSLKSLNLKHTTATRVLQK